MGIVVKRSWGVMIERYTDSTRIRPLILGLASLVPVIGVGVTTASDLLVNHVEQERQNRLDTLIKALEEGLEDFAGPIEVQRTDPVLHAAYVTIEATLRTSRRGKIRAFAKLLTAGLQDPPRISITNEHEDFLKILDELSMRELGVLAILADFESKNTKQESENDVQWTARYWEAFQQQACNSLAIPTEEFSGLMARLIRTGTFEPFVGAYLDYTGGRGKLTGTYIRLASLIKMSPEEFDTGCIV